MHLRRFYGSDHITEFDEVYGYLLRIFPEGTYDWLMKPTGQIIVVDVLNLVSTHDVQLELLPSVYLDILGYREPLQVTQLKYTSDDANLTRRYDTHVEMEVRPQNGRYKGVIKWPIGDTICVRLTNAEHIWEFENWVVH